MRSYQLMIWLTFTLTACAAPATTPVAEIQPTLPLPTAETTTAIVASPTPTTPVDLPAATQFPTETVAVSTSSPFVKMEVAVSGSASLDMAGSTLDFSDDFMVLPGPDLYVILSGATDLSLDYMAFSQRVTDAPILYLGELATVSGPQSYTIPASTDLSQYNTIVIWCKQYSVAFAAAGLR